MKKLYVILVVFELISTCAWATTEAHEDVMVSQDYPEEPGIGKEIMALLPGLKTTMFEVLMSQETTPSNIFMERIERLEQALADLKNACSSSQEDLSALEQMAPVEPTENKLSDHPLIEKSSIEQASSAQENSISAINQEANPSVTTIPQADESMSQQPEKAKTAQPMPTVASSPEQASISATNDAAKQAEPMPTLASSPEQATISATNDTAKTVQPMIMPTSAIEQAPALPAAATSENSVAQSSSIAPESQTTLPTNDVPSIPS